MRTRGWLLAIFAAAGALQVASMRYPGGRMPLQAGFVALVALAGYAALSRAAPLVRWPVTAAVSVLAGRAGLDWLRYRDPEPFEPSRYLAAGPLPVSNVHPAHLFAEGLRHGWPALLVYAGLLFAVLALPSRRRPVAGLAAALIGLAVIGDAVRELWSDTHQPYLRPLDALQTTAYFRMPLLIVSVAVAAAVLATQRDRFGLLAGLGVVVMTAPKLWLRTTAALAGVSPPVLPELPPDQGGAFLMPGYLISVRGATGDRSEVWLTAFTLAGLALAVIGCVRFPGRGR